jgi:hypothetical protein
VDSDNHGSGFERMLPHRILSAQEDKRKMISHDLQDEIAQTRLLTE